MENPAILQQENEDNLNAQKTRDELKDYDEVLDRIGVLSMKVQRELGECVEALDGVRKTAKEIGTIWDRYCTIEEKK